MAKNKKKHFPAHQISKKETESTFIAVGGQYSGPIPPPAHLEKYESILPGAADRIISMAESQAKHRQEIENKVISSDVKNSTLGLWFGFLIGLAGVITGFYLIYTGKVIEGSLYGGGTIVSLAGIFIYGSRQRKKERESKIQ